MPKSDVFCCDCLPAMREYPDGYFDLAVVDVPYGIGEDGGKKRSGWVKQRNGSQIFVKDGGYAKRGWDKKPPSTEYFEQLMRIAKNQIIFGANYINFPLVGGRIIWDKCNDGSDQSDAEIAYSSFDKRVHIFRYMWRGMFQGKSITEGTVQNGNKAKNEVRIHPTQKPVALYRWIYQHYAKSGDKILDTHMGSQSSRIAAYDAGLDYTGYEIDETYFKLGCERFERHAAQMNLFTDFAEQEEIHT